MDYQNYIFPELLVLIPVCLVIGKILHETSFFNNKFIPIVLGAVSIILSVCYVVGISDTFTASSVFTAVTQGVLTAGVSVYGNQLVKQMSKGDDDDE